MKKQKRKQNNHWPDCSGEGADLSVLREGWAREWKDWLGERVSREILVIASELPPFLQLRSC
ncbi:hypothetical protein EBT23_04100 [bacterium]|nr:hypothetical protein [bacterium]